MKAIHRDDLVLLIPMLSDIQYFDKENFENMLAMFGSEYHVVDSHLVCTDENKKMREIRELSKGE